MTSSSSLRCVIPTLELNNKIMLNGKPSALRLPWHCRLTHKTPIEITHKLRDGLENHYRGDVLADAVARAHSERHQKAILSADPLSVHCVLCESSIGSEFVRIRPKYICGVV